MITTALKNIEYFRLQGEASDRILYGSDQMWYRKRWQRMSGCGPSTVANIMYYLDRSGVGAGCCSNLTRGEYLELMNEIWKHVTPSLGGISSTGMLCRGAEKYLASKGLNINMDFIDIPKKKKLRPEVKQVLSFLQKAMESDTPVAFLNLEH